MFWSEFWAWNFPKHRRKGLWLSVHSKCAAKCIRYPNAAEQAVHFWEFYLVWKPASLTIFPSLLSLIRTLKQTALKYSARKAWKRRLEYYGTGHLINIRVWRAKTLTVSLWGTMHSINRIATGAYPERKTQKCRGTRQETWQRYHLLTNLNPWETPKFTQLLKEGR